MLHYDFYIIAMTIGIWLTSTNSRELPLRNMLGNQVYLTEVGNLITIHDDTLPLWCLNLASDYSYIHRYIITWELKNNNSNLINNINCDVMSELL